MKKLITSITAFVLSLFVTSAPVMATSVSPATTGPATTFAVDGIILKDCAIKGTNGKKGEGVVCVVQLVIDILTIGIGVVAVIGIVISGIQYITAGGNEEQTRKAKRRIFEIVIGLAAYAVIYLALYFLLPNFSTTPSS